jgi:MFS family permease
MNVVRVLRTPKFGVLLGGQAISAIGDWIAVIAIWGFAAFKFHAGATEIAVLFCALSAPGAFLGPLLGVPIDRLGPRRTLILANGLGFFAALALTQADSYAAIVVLALPLGLIESLGMASLDALPPRLVADEDLVSANALAAGAQDLGFVVGPLAAAALNSAWGLEATFAADAATFLVGMAVALPLNVGAAGRDGDRGESVWRELLDGLSMARHNTGLRWALLVAACTYLLWGLFGVLEPLYVRDVLHEPDNVFAFLQTVFGVGLVGAGFVLASVGDRLARPRHIAIALVISGGTAALYLGTNSVAVAFVAVFLWGVDVAFFYAPAKTLLQRYAPVAAHGRILSLNQSLEPFGSLVSTPLAAAVLAFASVQAVAVGGGAVAAAAGLWFLRRARRLPPPPATPVDRTEGTARDAIALGGPAPG